MLPEFGDTIEMGGRIPNFAPKVDFGSPPHCPGWKGISIADRGRLLQNPIKFQGVVIASAFAPVIP